MQVMALKREAFRRKQAGIKRGLEIGDAIIAQRRRVLVAAVLSSWRFRTKIGKEVQTRFAGYLRGSLQGAWGAWRRYHVHKVWGCLFKSLNLALLTRVCPRTGDHVLLH